MQGGAPLNSSKRDGGKHPIKSGTLGHNCRVPFALSPEVDVIATLPAMSERFDQGTSFVATFSMFGLSDA